MKNVVKKYLATYAEPEALVGAQLDRTTHRALVIPALGEDISMLERVAPAIDRVASRSERVLLVIVVNANERHEGDVLDLNDQLLHALDKRYRLRTLSKPGRPPVRYGHEEHHDVIVINRHAAEHRFHKRQGVGLARKLGCDTALSAIDAGRCHAPLIHMTDGDVRLSADYFEVDPPPDTSAVVYPFRHEARGNRGIDTAHAMYEAYLRYYVLGLKHAGSVYAFHTIGSCIAMVPNAYAQVRGVPNRQAGEDFYLLNKLCKVGGIHHPGCSPIVIDARRSTRVPFGTGRATLRIAQHPSDYRIYDPAVFDVLGAWLRALDDAATWWFDPETAAKGPATLHGYALERAEEQLSAAHLTRLDGALRQLGLAEGLTKLSAQRRDLRGRPLNDWFDAFRTLKLIHALRDAGFEDLPWAEALSKAKFCKSALGDSPPIAERANEICQRLARLEKGSEEPAASN